MIPTPHERGAERTWRLFRLTSMIAAAVLLVILLVIDFSFGFASSQLNITIALVAAFLGILLRMDTMLHRVVRQMRNRRGTRRNL
ncbi:MAG: hypothetical protein Q8922_02630 [Bacteroidota bacterium]|nr:hypothetical protein [Bacteroidota bacterium]MDP4234738.1 hypothetical protein [Bacteroidota bacterium]MDP4242630.1 hypothetical protein [Bacteroidota bacterium]MDP4286808.1 hypothetical protein [Bacteroidota bacterium]